MGVELVIAGRDPAELLELADEPLDPVALPIGLAIAIGVLRLVGPARDNRDDALAAQDLEQPRGRVGLVGDHGGRLPAWPATPAGAQGACLEQRSNAEQVMALAAGQVERHRPAVDVGTKVELGREAAARVALRRASAAWAWARITLLSSRC